MANFFQRMFDGIDARFSRKPSIITNASNKVEDDLAPSVRPLKYKFQPNTPTTRSQFAAAAGNTPQTIIQDYDLSVIDRFADNESILFQTFSKIEEKGLNNGYQFASKDQEAVDYIRRRLWEFAQVTKKPSDMFIREIMVDLIKYSNCFLYKMRDINNSTGKRVRVGDDVLEPVSAYIRLDPTSVVPEKDKQGNVIRYHVGPTHQAQFLLNIGKKVKPEDMFHFYIEKNGRNNLGTPYIWPVIDDIRVLRHMEENLELLVHKHLFPIYQYIVGTEQQPAEPEEIEKVTIDVENIPSEGGWVTPNRHKIEVLGAQGKAMDISKYLLYFRERVVMGLGIGLVSFGLGGGASRASSEVIDRNVVEKAKKYQAHLCTWMNDLMIPELMAERGYDIYSEKTPKVQLSFNEIDSDTQIKIENHAVNMFNNQAIDYDELRNRIGEDVKADNDFTKLQFNLFGSKALNDLAIELAKVGNAVATQQKDTADKAKGAAASVKSSDQPGNQHGQKNSPKRTRDGIQDSTYSTQVGSIKKSPNTAAMGKAVNTHFDSARQDIINSIQGGTDSGFSVDTSKDGVRYAMGMAEQSIYNTSKEYVGSSWENGYGGTIGGVIKDNAIRLRAHEVLEHHAGFVKKTVTDIENDVINILTEKGVDKASAVKRVSALFDVKSHYINSAVNSSVSKAYNHGRAHALKDLGHLKAYHQMNENACDDCKKMHGKEVDLTTISVNSIAPHHINCECSLMLEDPNV